MFNCILSFYQDKLLPLAAWRIKIRGDEKKDEHFRQYCFLFALEYVREGFYLIFPKFNLEAKHSNNESE